LSSKRSASSLTRVARAFDEAFEKRVKKASMS
jgi:hypothetical protein